MIIVRGMGLAGDGEIAASASISYCGKGDDDDGESLTFTVMT